MSQVLTDGDDFNVSANQLNVYALDGTDTVFNNQAAFTVIYGGGGGDFLGNCPRFDVRPLALPHVRDLGRDHRPLAFGEVPTA